MPGRRFQLVEARQKGLGRAVVPNVCTEFTARLIHSHVPEWHHPMTTAHYFCIELIDPSDRGATGFLSLSLFCNSCGQRQIESSPADGRLLIECIGCHATQPLSEARFLPGRRRADSRH